MRAGSLLYSMFGEPVARRAWGQGVLLLVLAIALAVFADRWGGTNEVVRARNLANAGERERAAELYWKALRTGPVTVPVLIEFLDARPLLDIALSEDIETDSDSTSPEVARQLLALASHVDDSEFEEFLRSDRVPQDAAVLARFWAGARRKLVAPNLREAVVILADASPPTRWANALLGRDAVGREDLDEALRRFDRETRAFADKDSIAHSFEIRLEQKDWDGIAQCLGDPVFAAGATPHVRYEYAVHARHFVDAGLYFFLRSYSGIERGPFFLACVTALLWFLFFARVGVVAEKTQWRWLLYLLAFLLGTLSVHPTLALDEVASRYLHLESRGEPIADALYYIFSVGLREEFSKALLFAPLIPLLRRAGKPLDVIVCGALVGLGFAAEENINYFQYGTFSVAIARFITANFMHMALTATVTSALYEFAKDTERESANLSRTFFFAMMLHGAYDFFLTFGSGFLAMMLLVVITGMFLRNLSAVRRGRALDLDLTTRFVRALVLVTAATFVYASAKVGVSMATPLVLQGLLGDVFIIIVFVKQLRES